MTSFGYNLTSMMLLSGHGRLVDLTRFRVPIRDAPPVDIARITYCSYAA